jgi:hypothetical protein
MRAYGTTDFAGDIEIGKIGEKIFVADFLEFLRVNYEDVTGVQGFRIIDSDFVAAIGRYEIKANYKDDKMLVIEEFTNANETWGPISPGWFYKSRADMLVFVSKTTRAMILVPFTDIFKAHYESIKAGYELVMNRVSCKPGGRKWQSAYRRIPLAAMNGFFAYYKRVP